MRYGFLGNLLTLLDSCCGPWTSPEGLHPFGTCPNRCCRPPVLFCEDRRKLRRFEQSVSAAVAAKRRLRGDRGRPTRSVAGAMHTRIARSYRCHVSRQAAMSTAFSDMLDLCTHGRNMKNGCGRRGFGVMSREIWLRTFRGGAWKYTRYRFSLVVTTGLAIGVLAWHVP